MYEVILHHTLETFTLLTILYKHFINYVNLLHSHNQRSVFSLIK